MKPVSKTYSKILLMLAAVLVALFLGFVLSFFISGGLWALAKPEGHLSAEIIWSVISAIIASAITYFVAYLLIRKCEFGKVKWINILCSILTLLWCILWAGFIVIIAEDGNGYDEYYYEEIIMGENEETQY